MHVDPYILSFSAVTVIATIFMGFWAANKSKTASDFFVAGRSVSVGWNASAISGEYLSAASFMGVAGMVMSSGYDALWYPVCYACGYLFLLLFIAGPLRRFGAYTIPDFAEGRYDSPIFRKIAVIFVMFIGFFYTMPQMKGAGTTLAYIFPGLPYWVGVALVGAVITLNVALGGMKGITLVQAFQYWAKMFAISVPIFVLMSVYGHYGKQLGANGENVERRASDTEQRINPSATELFKRVEFPALNYPSVIDAAKTEISKSAMTYALPNTSATVESILNFGLSNELLQISKRNLFLAKELDGVSVKYPANTTASSANFLPLIIEILKTNGVQVLQQSGDVWVYPTRTADLYLALNDSGSLRKPLPEKAPTDQKWISPFGPLTTKAVKAAKPTIIAPQSLDPVEFAIDSPNVGTRLREFSGVASHKFVLQSESFPVEALAQSYASAVSRHVFLNTATNGTILLSPKLKGLQLSIPADLNNHGYKDGVYADHLLAIFQTNGITVLREANNVFKIFPTKDAIIMPLDTKPYALLYTYSLIIALVCGTAGLPHILVRFYTNPDGVAAKRTTMWVMILIGIFYVFPPVFGVMGRNLLPELYLGAGSKGTDKVVLELPRILNERVPMLGSILSGITCAGAFAAFMSTFSGLLVSMTGALAHDVYGRILRPKSTPEQRMRMFKFGAVLIGGVAILLGMQVEQLEINFMVGQAFAIAAASYFPLLFMSVWWRGMTQKGAATGMLTGGLLALAGITLTSVSDIALKTSKANGTVNSLQDLENFWIAHPGIRILCEQPAIWAVPLAITLMIVVSKLTRKDVPSDIRSKMLVLHAPEKLGLKQEYIQEHQSIH